MAVSTVDERKPHQIVLHCAPFTSEAIRDWTNTSLAAEAETASDGLPAFRVLRDEVASHHIVNPDTGRAAAERPEFQWVNIVLSNLKTAINGTYHAFKFAKYAPRYLADLQYRFNRRYALRTILPRLLRDAAVTTPWPEHQLRQADVGT